MSLRRHSTLEHSYDITWRFPDGTERTTAGYRPLNLLGHGEVFEIAIPQACGGQAECGTCRVRVLKGELTPMTGGERELRQKHPKRFRSEERLSCQGRPRGDITLEILSLMPPDLRTQEST